MKNNNKTINRKLLIISVCIAILPILLGLSRGFISNESIFYEKVKIYGKYIPNIVKSAFFNDGKGDLRNDVISKKIERLQLDYKNAMRETDIAYEKYLAEPNPSADELKTLKDAYDKASSDFYQSYDKYKQQAMDNINDDINYLKIVNNPVNLEFCIEFKDGRVVSNISRGSIDSIIDETKNYSTDHLMFLDISNNSPKQTITTPTMNYTLDKLIPDYYVFRDTDVKLSNVIIRLPSSLEEGDELYAITQKEKISNITGYGASILLILDILIICIFIFRLIKQKDIKLESTNILKYYNKLPIDIKILVAIVIMSMLLGLYNIISPWGNDLIANYISYKIGQTPYLYVWSSFFIQLFILFIVTSIIGYLILCDIYQLYLNKNKAEARQYLYKNSIFCIVHNKFNNNFSDNPMSKKIKLTLVIFILYLALITWTTWLFTYYDIFWFYLLHGMTELYRIPAFVFISSLILSILGTVFIIKYIFTFFIDLNKIKRATDNIVKGNYNNELKIKNSSILKELADNITNIENGLDKAIGNAIKSERMKGELITNVSHDLKTPLTSIINYVDLLDKDNISEEKKKEYLGILAERSARLKVLIEDLFEASKAASGNLEMHMESLDPIALLRQTLGEFEDRINSSNLDFIKNIPDQKLTIYADGRRTFRIFQNLISNILKYSLSGTRVYIDVENKDDFVSITFKNISKYPLNFTEDEILERFKRGDSSRTTEGSGLGLSIAKSLVELQKGFFKLKLDGDLFKVEILLKKENF